MHWVAGDHAALISPRNKERETNEGAAGVIAILKPKAPARKCIIRGVALILDIAPICSEARARAAAFCISHFTNYMTSMVVNGHYAANYTRS